MVDNYKLLTSLWIEIINTTNYLINQIPKKIIQLLKCFIETTMEYFLQ